MSSKVPALLCFAINHFGDGQHPVASAENLGFFTASYIGGCLRKLRKSKKVSAEAKAIALVWLIENRIKSAYARTREQRGGARG